MPSRSSPECSPPCQGGDRGFKSHRGRWMDRKRTVRKRVKQSRPPVELCPNLGALWDRLAIQNSRTSTESKIENPKSKIRGWCSSRRSVKPLPSSGEAVGGRFDSFITQLHVGPVVYWPGRHPLKVEKGFESLRGCSGRAVRCRHRHEAFSATRPSTFLRIVCS